MREIQTATNREAETTATMDGSVDFSPARINDLHQQAEIWRGKTVADAGQACRCVIECGALLILAKAQCKHGDWLVWLESNCPDISQPSASRYMRVASKYSRLNTSDLDFQTLKELYIASGIMPEPEADHTESTSPQLPVWARLTTKLDAVIEKLKGEDRERLRQWCQLVLQRL